MELYDLTSHAYEAFQTNEELMRFYTSWKLQFSAKAFASAMTMICTAREIGTLSVTRAAIQPKNVVTSVGSTLSLVTKVTTTRMADPFMKIVSNGAVLGIYANVAVFAHNVRCAVLMHHKEQLCKEFAHLIWQVWQLAAEANTLLRWVYTSGESLCFQEDGDRQWEEFLKERIKKEVKLEYKSPEFVILYLSSQVKSIEAAQQHFEEKKKSLWPKGLQ